MARSPFLSNCTHQNCDKFSASKPFAVESFCIDCFRLRIFRSTTRCGGTERDGERICVCAAQNKIVSTDVRSTFDRALGWARWSGGCRGKRKRARAQVLHRGQKEVPCKRRLRKSPALGIWNDSQTPEHWCQLPSRGMGRDLAVRQSKRAGFVDHVNAAECRGEEDHLKRSLPYISTVFTRR